MVNKKTHYIERILFTSIYNENIVNMDCNLLSEMVRIKVNISKIYICKMCIEISVKYELKSVMRYLHELTLDHPVQ